MPVGFDGYFTHIRDIPLIDMGTAPVILNELEEIPNDDGDVVELTGNINFRNAGPFRFYEFLRNGQVVEQFGQFSRQGLHSTLTLKAYLSPPTSVSTYSIRTRGGTRFDDVFLSTLNIKIVNPQDP